MWLTLLIQPSFRWSVWYQMKFQMPACAESARTDSAYACKPNAPEASVNMIRPRNASSDTSRPAVGCAIRDSITQRRCSDQGSSSVGYDSDRVVRILPPAAPHFVRIGILPHGGTYARTGSCVSMSYTLRGMAEQTDFANHIIRRAWRR